jgi:hypothetical protein
MYVQVDAGSNGYAADQVDRGSLTLGELAEQLQELLDGGVDPATKAVIVTPGRYGANYYALLGVQEGGMETDEDEGVIY